MSITGRTLSGPGSFCIFSSMLLECAARTSRPTIRALFPCNQSYLIIVKHIIPGPVDEDRQPVSESDQAEDVEPNPDHPCNESAERQSPDARNCRVPSNGREQTRIPVLKCLKRFAFHDF